MRRYSDLVTALVVDDQTLRLQRRPLRDWGPIPVGLPDKMENAVGTGATSFYLYAWAPTQVADGRNQQCAVRDLMIA